MLKTEVTQEKLISARTLANTLSTSVRTVWRLRSAGELPKPVKIGASVRWRSTDIDQWIEWGCCNQAEFKARKGGRS